LSQQAQTRLGAADGAETEMIAAVRAVLTNALTAIRKATGKLITYELPICRAAECREQL
jgi:hypothetical protein